MTPDVRHEPHPLALLGHELRTPLTAVLGYADAMRAQAFGPLPEPYREQARVIHAAASHLLALVDTLTDVGAAEAGERALMLERMGAADLEALATDAASLLAPRAASAGVELRTAFANAAGVEIRADRVALTQVLVNLIDNAAKFALPGGTVTLRVEGVAAGLHMAVENGGGVGPPVGGAGSGLGLRLAKALSEAMGASLTLDLSSGGAARAVIHLPATAAG